MLIKLKDRKIVTLIDNEVTEIGDGFLFCNKTLTTLELPHVQNIGDDFLRCNTNIKKSDYVN